MELATCVAPNATVVEVCCSHTSGATVVDGRCLKASEDGFTYCYNNMTNYAPTNARYSLAECVVTDISYYTCTAANVSALAECCQVPLPGWMDGSKCLMTSAGGLYKCYIGKTGITDIGGDGAACYPSKSVHMNSAAPWKFKYGLFFIAAMTAVASAAQGL